MSTYKIKKITMLLLGSMVLAGILSVAVDFAIAWQGRAVSCSAFLLVFAALAAAFGFLFRRKPKHAVLCASAVLTLIAVSAAALFMCWRLFSAEAAFSGVDHGKETLYSDKRVMLIVPHQDDEINVLGGVMEEYVRYGSELSLVFVTNGDMYGLAEERFREALDVCDYIGIPEEQVYFLGYGDTWRDGGPHLYNAQPGEVLESYYGKTETYGTSSHGVYREGNAYTVENLLGDLKAVIEDCMPDIIYCTDYDRHIDHKATSLAFEKVMGILLKENPDYRPLVFKGYAYGTAWYAEPDFYEQNILSTKNLFEEPYYQRPAIYRWEERLRLPVWDQSLSRSLFNCRMFDTLALHASQEAYFQGARVINGDRVVWYRDTNSLCYDAPIRVSSGDGSVLNDFMIAENVDLVDIMHLPTDGTWVPEDPEKTVTVAFPQTVSIEQIVLYDNPSAEDNVLSGTIEFDDGSEFLFGPLASEGAPTVIEIQKFRVTSFTVTLLETEGAYAGLAEIEAFDKVPSHGLRYMKLMDEEENFVYDWILDGAEGYLKVYTQGLAPEESKNLTIRWDNTDCWAGFENDRIRVVCPEGEVMKLTVSSEGGDVSDTVCIRNPWKLKRLHYSLGQTLEEMTFQKYCEGAHRNSAVYKLAYWLLDLVR